MIARVPVESSNIAAIGFEDGKLDVEYKPNPKRPSEPPRVYRFEPCTMAEYLAIVEAPSVGKALFEFRRSPGLRATRLTPQEAWPPEHLYHFCAVPESEPALSQNEIVFNG